MKHRKARKYLGWDESDPGYLVDAGDVKTRWYIRTGSGLSAIGRAFGDVRLISYPGEYPGAGPGEYAFATEELTGRELAAKCAGMEIRSRFRIL